MTRTDIAKECLKNSLRSIADIVRVPLYGVAMTALSVFAIASGLIEPTTLYYNRARIGQLEVDLNWGKRLSGLMPCFQEIYDITDLPDNSYKVDTRYRSLSNVPETRLVNLEYHTIPSASDFERRLQNIARCQINFRRNSGNLFSLCDDGARWGKLRNDIIVQSAVYTDVKRFQALNPLIWAV